MARKPRIKHECAACGTDKNLQYRFARTPEANYVAGLGLKIWEGIFLCPDCDQLAIDGEWEELKGRINE